MKRNKNKPGKKRGLKSWLSIGAVVLVSIITLGIVAALISPVVASGSSGSGGSNSGNSTGSVSKPNVEDAPVVSYRLFNEMYFDEAYSVYHGDTEKYIPGMKIGDSFNYGQLDTSNGYLRYGIPDGESSDESYSEFSIYLSGYSTPENEVSVAMSAMDYLVIDFDVWTDTKYFNEMYLTFNHDEDEFYQFGISNLESEGVFITNSMIRDNYDGTGTSPGEFETFTQRIENFDEPIHITLFLVINQDSKEYLTSYTDGNLYTVFVNAGFDYSDIVELQFSFEKLQPDEQASVCFDNFQMCAYGVGDGNYSGDISTLLEGFSGEAGENNDDGMDIKNCRDWILYGKYE